MHYYLSGDTGNSTFKSIIFNTKTHGLKVIKQPTMSSSLLTLPSFHEENKDVAVGNLMNNLIVHTVSPALRRPSIYAIGEKSLNVGSIKRNMNIKIGDKHKEDLFILMPLSVVAAKAVQDHYQEHNEIPTNLDVNVTYSTAIPAREYTPEIARELENRFIKGNGTDEEAIHTQTIYAMKRPTVVNIKFNHVKVYQEGVPALQAIVRGDASMMAEYEEKYQKKLDNKALLKKNVLLIDIGDGTLELIYIEKGVPNIDLSAGKRLGVGHAADSALKLLIEEVKQPLNMTRHQFMKTVLDKDHHYNAKASEALTAANYEQVELIMDAVQDLFLNKLGGNVDLIIVTGGGSIVFKEYLSELLYQFADSAENEVLWIPEKMAPSLNAVGLDILNRDLNREEVEANA